MLLWQMMHSDEQGHATRPLPQVHAAAPIQRLVQVAAGETGQAGTVAVSLLAWWNAKSCRGFDLTDLWTIDDAIARDRLVTAAFIAKHWEYSAAYGLGPQFEQLVARWRPALARTRDV